MSTSLGCSGFKRESHPIHKRSRKKAPVVPILSSLFFSFLHVAGLPPSSPSTPSPKRRTFLFRVAAFSRFTYPIITLPRLDISMPATPLPSPPPLQLSSLSLAPDEPLDPTIRRNRVTRRGWNLIIPASTREGFASRQLSSLIDRSIN